MGAPRHELARWLSKAGVCSRTDAVEWIAAGRVRVDGRIERDADRIIDGSRAAIEVDGRRLTPPGSAPSTRRVLMLHKPRGCVTTWRDPEGRATVYDYLDGIKDWIAPIGRLDKDTSGLLLFTNDPGFAGRVLDPRHHVRKTYQVEAKPRVEPAALEQLAAGVHLDDGPTRPATVRHLRDRGPATILEIEIREGRNRQVRRMLRAVGSKVVKLRRTAVGGLELGELAVGTWRWLTPAEIAGLVPTAASA